MKPLIERLAPLTDEFTAEGFSACFSGESLVGAIDAEERSYVMLWPRLPGGYEPLLELDWRVQVVAAAPSGSLVALAGCGAAGSAQASRLHVTLLDLAHSRRADLVTGDDGVEAAGPLLVSWSTDGALLCVTGAAVAGEGLSLVFEPQSMPLRRWMLTGVGTRWLPDGLVLLEAHGCSVWQPSSGTTFLGDAPSHRSPSGGWTAQVVSSGLAFSGGGATRELALDAAHCEPVAWLGDEAVLLGRSDTLRLDLTTFELLPLVAPDAVLLAFHPHTRTFLFDLSGSLGFGRLLG